LPGCVSQGDTRQEALENIKEAIQLVLETLDGEKMVPGRVLDTILGENAPPYEDTPDLIAEEIRQILKDRHQDGLSYAGVSFEEVKLSAKPLRKCPGLPRYIRKRSCASVWESRVASNPSDRQPYDSYQARHSRASIGSQPPHSQTRHIKGAYPQGRF
jgi:hypothetical protein